MGVHAVFDPGRFERNFVRGDWVFSKIRLPVRHLRSEQQ